MARWYTVSYCVVGSSHPKRRVIARRISAGDRLASYGVVRVSLGLHNTVGDVDAVVEALDRIATSGPALAYRRVPSDETFEAVID